MTPKRRRTIRLSDDLDQRLAAASDGAISAFVSAAIEQRLASDGILETAIGHAVDTAAWLTDTDRPAIDLARHQARAIDEKAKTAQPGLFTPGDKPETSSQTYDRDVLFRMLDALGLSPRGRRDLNIEPADEVDEIAAIIDIAR